MSICPTKALTISFLVTLFHHSFNTCNVLCKICQFCSNKRKTLTFADENRSILLEWPKHYQIICGIAKGLLYLHHDSRLRFVHRDLKASNVLLDDDMNPKISNFGLARPFGGDQIEGNTHRVVGTYGYMAPEYASDGIFLIKSDVFSFGILILEIVSGRKSRSVYEENCPLNLVGYVSVHTKILNECYINSECYLFIYVLFNNLLGMDFDEERP
ncbi:receptor-like serine/threonine-protein kinase SD1-7 [Cannabis sativa]|uniref:receptor-like serine/threonine-protein kinase SD1-7 n=1 Tax=Cannabis sativa TaxID=3483 RepID=UPI0029CA6752|nr:receptor-like serine/threonine-protein kinase SD1-7 [Cannabis sativa]